MPPTVDGSATPKPHVVSSAIEHPAITKCLDHLMAEGKVEVTYVGVDEEGRVSSEEVVDAIRPETALVTIMHSNNEVWRDAVLVLYKYAFRDHFSNVTLRVSLASCSSKILPYSDGIEV